MHQKCGNTQRLFSVLQKLQDAGKTLNPEKCEFMKNSIAYIGHNISKERVSADSNNAIAITELPHPYVQKQSTQIHGDDQPAGTFSCKLAELTSLLSPFLGINNE